MNLPIIAQLLTAITWLLFGIFLLALAAIAGAIHPILTLVLALLACGAATRGMRLVAATAGAS